MTVGSGASIVPSSATAGVVSANELNGTSLAGLGTGVLFNTTATGASSIAALSGNLVYTSTGIGTSQAINAQTGTTYTIATTDTGKLLTFNNASPVAVSLPVATTTGFTAGFSLDVHNYGAGTVTITPTTRGKHE